MNTRTTNARTLLSLSPMASAITCGLLAMGGTAALPAQAQSADDYLYCFRDDGTQSPTSGTNQGWEDVDLN